MGKTMLHGKQRQIKQAREMRRRQSLCGAEAQAFPIDDATVTKKTLRCRIPSQSKVDGFSRNRYAETRGHSQRITLASAGNASVKRRCLVRPKVWPIA